VFTATARKATTLIAKQHRRPQDIHETVQARS
jgi:hypothetical protein